MNLFKEDKIGQLLKHVEKVMYGFGFGDCTIM